jgi:hypothetical protein
MGDETKTIADGASCRMVNDPAAVAASEAVPGPTPQTVSSGQNKFILIVIAAAAAAIRVGVVLAIESPPTP